MNEADFEGLLRDTSELFFGGVDTGRSAADVSRNQLAGLLNGTVRNGPISPRPGWIDRPLTFGPGIADLFQLANFQEGFFYDGNGIPALLSSHGGRQFKIDIATWSVTEITPIKSYTTLTTGAYTIGAVGVIDSLNLDTTNMSEQQPIIIVNGYTLTLTSIKSAVEIGIVNNIAAQVGIVIPIGSTVLFVGVDPNSPLKKLNWSIQAENYWILQDNQSYPVIFDGSSSFRSDPAKKQVPVGNVMCYAAGRIAVALPDRQTYRVGDLIFGSSGTILNGGKDAILYFQENDYLNEGGDFVARVFGAPSNSGPIMAMKAVSQADTQLGQGPMLVGCPNVVFTVNLPYDRTIWKNLANALQTATPIIGPTGQSSTVLVNTDLWYRSLDGIRSYIMAQRQFNTGPGNTPLSNEVMDYINADTDQWLEWGSAVLFDNRLLMTVSPQQNAHGMYHRGLVVLDYTLISGLKKSTQPAWEGVWTGPRILKIVSGLVNNVPRCFVYYLGNDNRIGIWELSTASLTDQVPNALPISFQPQTCAYSCGNQDTYKRLKTARFIFREVIGEVSVSVDWRADESACWRHWADFVLCSKASDCGPFDCAGPETFSPQTRWPVRLPDVPDVMDTITKHKANTGFVFQIRLTISGSAQVASCRIYCIPETEPLGIETQITTEICDIGADCGCDSQVFTLTNPA